MGALGLTQNKAKDIVSIGREFDLLVADEPEEAVALSHVDDDEDKTILRLVLPEERPDLFADNVEKYADRSEWEMLWDKSELDHNAVLKEKILKGIAKNTFNIDSDAEIAAILAVGEMAGCIILELGGYRLSSERPEMYWIDIWESNDVDIESNLSGEDIKYGIIAEEGIPFSEAEEIFEDAVSRGEIYSPPFEPDDKYVINDPATDEGPDISQKLGGETTDDNDDDTGDNGNDGQQTDANSDDSPPAATEEGGDSGGNEDGSDEADTSDTSEEAPHRLPTLPPTQTPQNRLVSNRTPKPIHPPPKQTNRRQRPAQTRLTRPQQLPTIKTPTKTTPQHPPTSQRRLNQRRTQRPTTRAALTRAPPRPNRTTLTRTTPN